ncbi:erythromycin esterase family protein [Desulfoscipio gibsoniae]|uniref:Erythromycin esterase-like enzyme n=1 Tax=Desulfoscipio gibsoniae DSM 7213 TaxID=767817 RepID=R4KQE8_9FIRM|nr:erythromycin esterase family protein [Desulfoscipio gibsoniae]AGL02805.1 erythromycin esterase-like enzyme [Desulfoscipio gibsoniae DSM 7213]
MKKVSITIMALFICLLSLSGCQQAKSTPEISQYVQPINTLQVNDGVKIVGLGEATHGNKEFQQLKKDIFEALVNHNNCRIFALEGDFGGCAKVNNYILDDEGTAKEAVAEIGFAIYRTKEMEELVQWMHDYNQTAKENEKLKFYGFDMQRYDNSKEFLFMYLNKVDNALSDKYRELLADLNDETVYNQDKAKVKQALSGVEELMETMTAQKDNYIALTSEKEYQFAYQCAQSIKENATLHGTNANYSQTRDEYMKNKIDWILNYENNQMIFITGHNGHIGKTSAASGYTSMGNRLADSYGDQYYAIGTDFYKSTFNTVTSTGKSKVMTVHHSNDLTRVFTGFNSNINFIDFASASQNPQIAKILQSTQSMGNIGAEFNDWQKISKMFYTLKMKPARAYNALIFVNKGM